MTGRESRQRSGAANGVRWTLRALRSAALALLLAAGAAHAEDAPRVALDAAFGLGNVQIAGRWLPVAVTVRNTGGGLAGELRLVLEKAEEAVDVYRRPVDLPGGSVKRFELEVLGGGGYSLGVEVRDDSGRVVAETRLLMARSAGAGLVAIAGSSWLGLEAGTQSRAGGLELVRLGVETAPRNALGYDAVECVLVGPDDPASPLPAAARAALVAWVRGGGCVVIDRRTLADGFLPGVARGGADWTEAVIPASDLAALAPGVPPPPSEVHAVIGPLPGAVPLWPRADGRAWVQSLPEGLGEVIVTAFAADQPALRGWPGLRRLWERLLEVDLTPPPPGAAAAPGAAPGPHSTAAGALAEVPAGANAVFVPLALFLLIYPVLYGLALYLYVRRLRGGRGAVPPGGRPTVDVATFVIAAVLYATATAVVILVTGGARVPMAIVAAFGAALLVRWWRGAQAPAAPLSAGAARGVPFLYALLAAGTATATLVAATTRPEAPAIRRLTVARRVEGAAPEWRGTTMAGIYAPAGGRLDVDLADPEGVLALVGGEVDWRHPCRRLARADVSITVGAGPTRIDGLALGRGDAPILAAEWRAPVAVLDAIRIRAEGDGLWIRNGTPLPLRSLQLWDGRHAVFLDGELASGAAARIGGAGAAGGAASTVVPPGGTGPDARAGLAAWLRGRVIERCLRVGGPDLPAAYVEVLRRWRPCPRRFPPGRRVLLFRIDADAGVLSVRDPAGASQDLLLAEVQLP